MLQPPICSEDKREEREEEEEGGNGAEEEEGNKEGGREKHTQEQTEQHLCSDHGNPILFFHARYSTGVKMAGVSSRMARWIL